jgi:hypothetical protein
VISNLLNSKLVDAIEIHTQLGHEDYFRDLFSSIGRSVFENVKILAVSFPNMKNQTLGYLNKLQNIIESHESWKNFEGLQIWQADGRPMSGDIGKGTARESVELAKRILYETNGLTDNGIDFKSRRHFVQLAGGTNNYSIEVVQEEQLTNVVGFGGFAFGGYARKFIGQCLNELEKSENGAKIEEFPSEFNYCFKIASNLVRKIKD